ncbi:putative lipoprotein [Myxococcus hansupus]|uniref:Putative lipoprotein n=1 Tax=Pseudomyxococcus hansupus TaxID=1297742 RepID=A0A0H4X1V8_9BACT|nr:hypothetical protein [Myxococcus hansupus]AKQ69646.1 putative lipoprotein [Myxococcus hansupus]
MTKFLKTKAVLASLAAGALVFGTACKSDSSATRDTSTTGSDMGTIDNPNSGTSTDTNTTTPPGTGGTGMDDPTMTPMPDDTVDPNNVDPNMDPTLNPGTGGTGTEVDPNLDPNMGAEPGTGGAGDVEPRNEDLDVEDDTTLEPGTGGSGMTDPDTRMTPPTPLPESGTQR